MTHAKAEGGRLNVRFRSKADIAAITSYRDAMNFPLHLWPTGYLFLLGLSFYYFILAGARTFEMNPGDELASGVAQFSFLITGTLGTLYLGYGRPISLWNGIGSAVLLCMAMLLSGSKVVKFVMRRTSQSKSVFKYPGGLSAAATWATAMSGNRKISKAIVVHGKARVKIG